MTKNKESYFKNKAHKYEAFRPEYPEGTLQKLENSFGLEISNLTVAEFGCGTGKLTEQLVQVANIVHAIDADKEMIEFVRSKFSKNPRIVPICSTAEASTLKNSSVDHIFVAQAFHHFDVEKTVEEFNRVLKPRGKIFLLWYFSDMTQEVSKSVRKCFYDYGDKLKQAMRLRISLVDIINYFPDAKVSFDMIGEIQQRLNSDEFLESMKSSSYAPVEGEELASQYEEEMKKIFGENESNGYVTCRFFVHAYMIEYHCDQQ